MWTESTLAETCGITVLVLCGFLLVKTCADRIRRRMSRVSVVVIGAGPVGLAAALMAARTGKATALLIFEAKSRHKLLCNLKQLALDRVSLDMFASLGVDFDNIEGCWDSGRFFTREGVFQEYLISLLSKIHIPHELRFKTKVS